MQELSICYSSSVNQSPATVTEITCTPAHSCSYAITCQYTKITKDHKLLLMFKNKRIQNKIWIKTRCVFFYTIILFVNCVRACVFGCVTLDSDGHETQCGL